MNVFYEIVNVSEQGYSRKSDELVSLFSAMAYSSLKRHLSSGPSQHVPRILATISENAHLICNILYEQEGPWNGEPESDEYFAPLKFQKRSNRELNGAIANTFLKRFLDFYLSGKNLRKVVSSLNIDFNTVKRIYGRKMTSTLPRYAPKLYDYDTMEKLVDGIILKAIEEYRIITRKGLITFDVYFKAWYKSFLKRLRDERWRSGDAFHSAIHDRDCYLVDSVSYKVYRENEINDDNNGILTIPQNITIELVRDHLHQLPEYELQILLESFGIRHYSWNEPEETIGSLTDTEISAVYEKLIEL